MAIDLYVFKALYPLLQSDNRLLKFSLIGGYWLLSVAMIALLLYGMSTFRQSKQESALAMYVLGAFFVIFIPKILIGAFHVIDDVFNLFGWSYSKLSLGTDWSRRNFITKLGLGVGAVLFGGLVYGVTKGKFAWRVLRNELASNRVPKAFDGFKIVQLSDAHLGSFVRNYEPVEKMVDMVNELEPDIIVFTGDMVNEHAQEAEGWEPVFSRLKAKHGKYSVFGNHDYAQYGPYSEEERIDSVDRLKAVHRQMGFNLMEDEQMKLEKDGEYIRLMGVHNWGKSRHFPKLGDLDKTLAGTRPEEFKVLLSHDPTHFEEKIMGKLPIDLTLSGHTHGSQMGIEIPSLGIKFSPVKFAYKRWCGLYKEGDQHLHVNRGMGVLAFPGRVGMAPEITLITLKSA
ncbi:MAG: metallophosphoesterase [Flavobacteriales bacterium]|nr:metallophosphoesterase [Flavobacteriales bacterium]